MLIYVINLDRRPDRREAMQRQFAALGVDYQRVTAIDGATLPPPVIRSQKDLMASEIACHRSHRLCWQALVDSGESHALVLEDDIIVAPRLLPLLATPEFRQADIIRVEETDGPGRFLIGAQTNVGGVRMWRPTFIPFGSGAYIMSRSSAVRLLADDRSSEKQVDALLFRPNGGVLGRYTVLQTDPGFCRQLLTGSPIAVSDLKADREALGRDENDPHSAALKRPTLAEIIKTLLRPVYLPLVRGGFEKTIVFAGDRDLPAFAKAAP